MSVYPIGDLDCIQVKVRDAGAARTKAVYLALDINLAGEKALLGILIAQTKGGKFLAASRDRTENLGLQDIFIVCLDGDRKSVV